jgi:hypothetical protein
LFGPVLVYLAGTNRFLVREEPVSTLDRDGILALRTLAEGHGGRALKEDAALGFLIQAARERLAGGH